MRRGVFWSQTGTCGQLLLYYYVCVLLQISWCYHPSGHWIFQYLGGSGLSSISYLTKGGKVSLGQYVSKFLVWPTRNNNPGLMFPSMFPSYFFGAQKIRIINHKPQKDNPETLAKFNLRLTPRKAIVCVLSETNQSALLTKLIRGSPRAHNLQMSLQKGGRDHQHGCCLRFIFSPFWWPYIVI